MPSPVHNEQPAILGKHPDKMSLFHAIAEHIPAAALFVVDQDLRYVHAGGQGLRAAGLNPKDFEGKFLADVVPPELLSQYLADYTAIFAGEPFLREHYVGERFYRTRGRLIKGENGLRDLAMAVSYDITDETRASG